MKMSAKSNKRRKLQTTLGKAAEVPKNEEDDVDLAHLRKPIGTSIFGLREVLSLLQTATEEVNLCFTLKVFVVLQNLVT